VSTTASQVCQTTQTCYRTIIVSRCANAHAKPLRRSASPIALGQSVARSSQISCLAGAIHSPPVAMWLVTATPRNNMHSDRRADEACPSMENLSIAPRLQRCPATGCRMCRRECKAHRLDAPFVLRPQPLADRCAADRALSSVASEEAAD